MSKQLPEKPIDMYNMIGYCPADVLKDEHHFVFRNLADGSDAELISMQRELINFLAQDVLKLSVPASGGLVLHSGSEANETAVLISKKITHNHIVVTSNLCHSSIDYACSRLGLKHIKLDIDPSTFKVSPTTLAAILSKFGPHIAMLGVTYGTTKLGTVEDMSFSAEIERLIRFYEIRLHVDAAYGGMIMGLIGERTFEWKTSAALSSITVDPHKFVGALGCGVLLLTDPADKLEIGEEVIYFPGNASALGTTRSAYPLATSLAVIRDLQIGGLRKLAEECHQRAVCAAERIQQMGFRLIVPVSSGVVPIQLNSSAQVDYAVAELLKSGFKVSPIRIAVGEARIYGIRIVVTPKIEITPQSISAFLDALGSICCDLPE